MQYQESIDRLEIRNCHKIPGHAGSIVSMESAIQVPLPSAQARQIFDDLNAVYVLTYRPTDAETFYESVDRHTATYDSPIDRTTKYRGYYVTLIGIGLFKSSTNEVIYSKNYLASVADRITFALKQVQELRDKNDPAIWGSLINSWEDKARADAPLLDDF